MNKNIESELIKIGKFIGIEYSSIIVDLKDEDIENEIFFELEQCSEMIDVIDRDIVEYGDFINIKYITTFKEKVLKIAEDEKFFVGYGDYDLNFENQLIGLNVNTMNNFSLKIPDDYSNKNLAGEIVDYEVKIKGIYKFEVPILDEEFVKLHYNVDTIEQFYDIIVSKLYERENRYKKAQEEDIILRKICYDSKFKLNKDEVQKYYNNIIEAYEEIAYIYDLSLEDY